MLPCYVQDLAGVDKLALRWGFGVPLNQGHQPQELLPVYVEMVQQETLPAHKSTEAPLGPCPRTLRACLSSAEHAAVCRQPLCRCLRAPRALCCEHGGAPLEISLLGVCLLTLPHLC